MSTCLTNLIIKKIVHHQIRARSTFFPYNVKDVVNEKFQNINKWYMRVIGLEEVKQYQDKVTQLQEKLLVAQERRRKINKSLAEIRHKSNEIQEQLHKVKRQDDLKYFLELMREETEMLQKEKEISSEFQEADQEEREIFAAFTNAVRDAHAKQRSQLEYTKYFGLVLSIFGSFLTFCYSTLKKSELKKFIQQQMISSPVNLQPIVNDLNNTNKDLNSVVKTIHNIVQNETNLNKVIEKFSENSTKLLKENNEVLNLINLNQLQLKKILEKTNNKKNIENNDNPPEILLPNHVIYYGVIIFAFIVVYKTFC